MMGYLSNHIDVYEIRNLGVPKTLKPSCQALVRIMYKWYMHIILLTIEFITLAKCLIVMVSENCENEMSMIKLINNSTSLR